MEEVLQNGCLVLGFDDSNSSCCSRSIRIMDNGFVPETIGNEVETKAVEGL